LSKGVKELSRPP